jgi:MOSC domain-containing protein YiiM
MTAQAPICRIAGVFIGGPKILHDAAGAWRSSIARDPVTGPAVLETRGFVGDKATQSYHGHPDSAVCLHSLTHYQFWNKNYGLSLRPGGVGENLTLYTWDESTICAGDIFRIGSARLQISGPRTPCENQARRVGVANWIELTLQEARTGLYARVLTPGTLQAGDEVLLDHRPNPGLTVESLTRCYLQDFDPALAEQLVHAEGLMPWWQQRFAKRLERPDTQGL